MLLDPWLSKREWWWFSHSVVSNSWDPMDCSLTGSSVRGIFQARILKWIAISFARGSFPSRNQTWVSCIADSLPTELQGNSTREYSAVKLLWETILNYTIYTHPLVNILYISMTVTVFITMLSPRSPAIKKLTSFNSPLFEHRQKDFFFFLILL